MLWGGLLSQEFAPSQHTDRRPAIADPLKSAPMDTDVEGVEFSREALAGPPPARQLTIRCRNSGEVPNEAEGEKDQRFLELARANCR